MQNIFDSHAHYDDKQFDPDRDTVLSGLPAKGVRYVMNAACNLESARAGMAMAERHPLLYCSAGVHPHDAKDAPEGLEEQITRLVKHPRVMAVGEIGLDYHYDFSPRERQREVFSRQLALAVELDLPVIVHDREAHADTLELLRRYRPKGIVHCYSGSAETARELAGLGLYLGFTGVITFKNAKKALAAAAEVPPDRLLIETDCPYMAPEPYRGKRCDSSMLDRVVQTLAARKGVHPQWMADRTLENACEIYRVAP